MSTACSGYHPIVGSAWVYSIVYINNEMLKEGYPDERDYLDLNLSARINMHCSLHNI